MELKDLTVLESVISCSHLCCLLRSLLCVFDLIVLVILRPAGHDALRWTLCGYRLQTHFLCLYRCRGSTVLGAVTDFSDGMLLGMCFLNLIGVYLLLPIVNQEFVIS